MGFVMRIFLFFILSFFSIFSYAATCAYYVVGSPDTTWPTAQQLCTSKFNSTNIATFSGGSWSCSKTSHIIASTGDCSGGCAVGATFVYSGSVTIKNWLDDNEYLNLTDQAAAKFEGTSICASQCIHSFDFLGDGEGDLVNGPITFSGRYSSTTQSCSTTSSGPIATLSGTKTDGGDNGGGDNGGGDNGGGGTSPEDALSIISAIRTQGQKIEDKITSQTSIQIDQHYSFKNDFFDRLTGISDYITAIFNRQKDTNEILASIDDKLGDTPPTGGTGSESTDEKLDTQTGILQEISDKLDTFFSDEGSEDIAALGSESNDSRHQAELQKSSSLFNKLGSLLNFSDKQCVSDFEIDTGIYGIVKIPLSEWCTLMAIIKLFLHLYVLLLCLRMIQRTISEI